MTSRHARHAPVRVAPLPSRAGGVSRRATDRDPHAGPSSQPLQARGFLLPVSRHPSHEDAPMTTITTSELRDRLDDPTLTIVDVRPLAAYNGWRRGSASPRRPRARAPSPSRSPGSRSSTRPRSSACSTRRASPPGATSSSTATARPRPPRSSPSSTTLGIEGARIYEGGAAAWAADESLPLDRLPNYDKLVDIQWLREVLDGGTPGGGAQRASSCSSTSTSACPRSTPRATSRARSSSTRTGSRTRPTGTAARPRRSTPRCAPSASPATRRSSSTAATPRVRPTRSGPAVAPARSPRRGR